MNQVTVTYFGMDGTGRTVTDAKRDAGAKIEKALDGYYTPRILRHAHLMALVAREPLSGWGYRLIHESTQASEPIYLSMSRQTAGEVIQSAFHHMAQLVGHYEGIENQLTDRQKRELDDYYGWQRRYAEFREQGYSDNDCHRLASGFTVDQVTNQRGESDLDLLLLGGLIMALIFLIGGLWMDGTINFQPWDFIRYTIETAGRP